MATIEHDASRFAVRFSRGEKIAGLLRDLDLPRSAVVDAEVEPDGVAAVQGLRAPGLGLPRRKIGTWRQRGRRTVVSVTGGQPAVRVRLSGAPVDEVLVGDPDAVRTAELLRAGRP